MGTKRVIVLNIGQLILAYGALLSYTYIGEYKLWAAAIVTFTFGFMDSGINCFVLCVCGFQFSSKTLPFSCTKLVYALSACLTFYLEALVNTNKDFAIFFMTMFLFGLSSWLLFYFTFDLK